MSFSQTQLRAMALSPKVASAFSIPGSCWILFQTIRDVRQAKKRQSSARAATTPMQRALAGMSLVDIASSLAWFASTWAAPEDSGALYAMGNEATCRAQGFLLQVAIGAPLYNGALILYYLLTIKYKWNDADLRRLEPWIHAGIWIWCIGTSVVVWSMDLLHYIGPVCWISDPWECWEEEIPGGVTCNRAKRFSTALFCIPLWISISLTIYALVEIMLAVRAPIRKMAQRTVAGGARVNELQRAHRDLQAVTIRAVLYSLAFIVTWTSSTIWSVAQWFDYYPFWVSYMWTLFEPLQGLWNCCIFLYNRPDSRDALLRVLMAPSSLFRDPHSSSNGTDHGNSSSSRSNFVQSWKKYDHNKRKSDTTCSSNPGTGNICHSIKSAESQTGHETSHTDVDPVVLTEFRTTTQSVPEESTTMPETISSTEQVVEEA